MDNYTVNQLKELIKGNNIELHTGKKSYDLRKKDYYDFYIYLNTKGTENKLSITSGEAIRNIVKFLPPPVMREFASSSKSMLQQANLTQERDIMLNEKNIDEFLKLPFLTYYVNRLTINHIDDNKLISVFKKLNYLKGLKIITKFNFKLLEYIPNLEHLDVSSNGIRENIISFSENLKYIPKLKYLDMSNSIIGHEIENFKFIPNLQYLNVSNCNIGDIIQFSRNLKYLPNLQHLDVSANDIKENIIPFSENLKYVPNLQHLNISHNRIGESIVHFSENLKYVPNLQHLDISWDHIDESIIPFSENLKYVPNLLYLNLRSIGTEVDIASFSENLKYIPNLQHLEYI